jgi:hypothetical protein
MKIRQGFVSNSSSSSFVILKRNLTEHQIQLIKDHYEVCSQLSAQGSRLALYCKEDDIWEIRETDFTIEGQTWMDNFSMNDYLSLIVQVNPNDVDWGD